MKSIPNVPSAYERANEQIVTKLKTEIAESVQRQARLAQVVQVSRRLPRSEWPKGFAEAVAAAEKQLGKGKAVWRRVG